MHYATKKTHVTLRWQNWSIALMHYFVSNICTPYSLHIMVWNIYLFKSFLKNHPTILFLFGILLKLSSSLISFCLLINFSSIFLLKTFFFFSKEKNEYQRFSFSIFLLLLVFLFSLFFFYFFVKFFFLSSSFFPFNFFLYIIIIIIIIIILLLSFFSLFFFFFSIFQVFLIYLLFIFFHPFGWILCASHQNSQQQLAFCLLMQVLHYLLRKPITIFVDQCKYYITNSNVIMQGL